MSSPEELLVNKWLQATQRIRNIRNQVAPLSIKELKSAIQSNEKIITQLSRKRDKIDQIIYCTLGLFTGAVICTDGFSLALKHLNISSMLHSNAVGTIAGAALTVEVLIFERHRRKHLELELEQEILIDTLLSKVE